VYRGYLVKCGFSRCDFFFKKIADGRTTPHVTYIFRALYTVKRALLSVASSTEVVFGRVGRLSGGRT